jgi:hypothetical protein
VGKEWTDVARPLGATKGDDQHRIEAHVNEGWR